MATKKTEINDKMSEQATTDSSPFIVMVFGIGWLIGAGSNWYLGLAITCYGAAWQSYRNYLRDGSVKDGSMKTVAVEAVKEEEEES